MASISFVQKIFAIYRLTRFNHAVMLAVAALVGQIIALGKLPDVSTYLLLTLLPPVFVETASFAINDYYDLESDRLNKKTNRPLVNGHLSPRTAVWITAASFAIGIVAAYFINTSVFLITAAFSVLAFLYSYKLKDVAVAGNAIVAASSALPFFYGNLVVAPNISPAVLSLAAIAFVVSLGRELTITIQDMEGDKQARKAKTLPIIVGARSASFFALFLFLAGIFLSTVPFLYIRGFSGDLAYAVTVAIADLLLLYVGIGLLAWPHKSFYSKARKLTFAALVLGLLGFLLGAVL